MPASEDPALSPRAEQALPLAVEAGERFGLTVEQPRVLHDIFNVLVHLAPSPVVVRVPSLEFLPTEERAAQQRRELAVAGWLADNQETPANSGAGDPGPAGSGVAVVRPSPLVPREPALVGGRSVTFWEFVTEVDPFSALTTPEAMEERLVEQAGWTAGLHARLADYPGQLPLMTPFSSELDTMLAQLRAHPGELTRDELARVDQEHTVLSTLVNELPERFPDARVQPLHGDAPAYNLLRTGDGWLFSDFEEVTSGPVELDLALIGPRAVEEYERVSGTAIDRSLLNVLEGGGLLRAVAALALTPRMPELSAMLQPAIDQWRARPPLTMADIGG